MDLNIFGEKRLPVNCIESKKVWIIRKYETGMVYIRGIVSDFETLKEVLGPYFEKPGRFSWEEVPIDTLENSINPYSCLKINFLTGEVIIYSLGEEFRNHNVFRLIVGSSEVECIFEFPYYDLEIATKEAMSIRKRMLAEDKMNPGLYDMKTLERL